MNQQALKNSIRRCQEKNIVIPTYDQMKHPEKIPARIREQMREVGLWDLNPLNLFRISWKNDPVGGGFGKVNYLELPPALTGVKTRIFALIGKYFPTGAHKVGATFGPLVSRLVRGEFDPTVQKAVWPSTGNYCRGGAFNSFLLGCTPIAILPEEMSRERFEWLEKLGSEVIATPGCESNVKEIYDKCWELKATRGDDVVILNQFAEFPNPMWHYEVTGAAMEEVLKSELTDRQRFAGVALSTGSAGTIACGDYLKKVYPTSKVCASEALQCPTLLYNGFGGHRIEGIGDKHVPWIHNVRNTDLLVGIDDEDTMRLLRLFNEDAGQEELKQAGVDVSLIEQLHLVGISGICNILSAIKMAKYYELGENDALFTILTDSAEMYQSRLGELKAERGDYTAVNAAVDFQQALLGQGIAHTQELTYWERRRVHNLKYFTWVEQQGKSVEELNQQWFDADYWDVALAQASKLDEEIIAFNEKTGVLARL
jgi:cysteine synthase A